MTDPVRKRGAIKRKLTLFEDFVNEFKAERDAGTPATLVDLIQLRKRLEDAGPLISQYEGIQLEVDEASEDIEEESSFQKRYYASTSLAESLLKTLAELEGKNGDVSVHNSSNGSVNGSRAFIQLPTIKLPTFDGKPEEWLNFRDLFSSLIDANEELSEVHKLHYLRASLAGRASESIKGLAITTSNYKIAWDGLNDRFNNSRALIYYHIKELFTLDNVPKESSAKLRSLVDSLKRNMRSLDSLVNENDQREAFLIYLLQSKLDSTTNREFENHLVSDQVPSLDDLVKFVEKKASLLETIEQKSQKTQNSSSRAFVVTAGGCPLCNGGHALYSCNQFKRLNAKERQAKAKQLRVCLNCLVKGHFNRDCKSKYTCSTCKAKHHSLLHIEARHSGAEQVVSVEQVQQPPLNIAAFTSRQSGALLPTVAVIVSNRNGQTCQVKALLDSGSMSSFISASLRKRLKLPDVPTNVQINGISSSSTRVTSRCDLAIQSLTTHFKMNASCLVIPEIIGTLPCDVVDIADWKIPNHLNLADPSFNTPANVEVLLGANYFWDILYPERISLGKGKPVMQNSKFGWVISGSVPFNFPSHAAMPCNVATTCNVDDSLRHFWELEEIPKSKLLSQEELDCEAHFKRTVKRDVTGRFVVNIPFKESPDALGDSLNQAKHRFYNLEKRMNSNSELRDRYVNFMNEYEKLGHMRVVSAPAIAQTVFYLPHHGVLKEDSLTTKLRVVFDGSARTTTGQSLNDIQMIGPVIQSELFAILVRFRKYLYVFSTDIEKMYRQVLITEEQRPLQRILWRPSPEKPLCTYELQTVTYGTASASFLATRCLSEVGIEYTTSNPMLSKIIQRDFYVDDCLSGSNVLSDAQQTCALLSQTLAASGFPLRKWLSNDPRVLKNVQPSDLHPNLHDFGSHAKTLGLLWSSHTDRLLFSISEFAARTVTKRIILADIAQIFDPLGLLAPCVMIAKFMLQSLWLEKVSWDTPVPSSLSREWLAFRSALPELNVIRIARNVICKNPTSITLHAFCDASIRGYGACIYLRSVNEDGEMFSNLLCSKGKVAPLKHVSIPRLELCGALTLARLVNQVVLALDANIDKLTFWTDSTIVLGWLKSPPNRLKVFVAHRVSEIQDLSTNGCWRHVPSESNPADLISRGTLPHNLVDSDLWFHGPEWLTLPESHWPSSKFDVPELPELKCEVSSHTAVVQPPNFPISTFSSLTRLKHVVAYCLRFRSNCLKPKAHRNFGLLTLSELDGAMNVLLKISQAETFARELKSLEAKRPLKSSTRLINLNPFVGQDGLIRVGGRIGNSSYPFSKKHPVVISGSHPLARLIVACEHLNLLHAGPQLLLSVIREKYWIISGRNLAKKIVHSCVKCFRFSPKITSPIMGDLPRPRIEQSFPFQHAGVDYAGPFLLKDRKGRGGKTTKCYICLFVCLATKAVHLELVSDLSSEVFIQSMRRFVARRGRPDHMYSDNGTNFVGAKSTLKELWQFMKGNQDAISLYATDSEIHWHFIPGYSPHFGGLWEAGVKSSKHHLKRVVGNASLTFEEFSTLLTQVEAILNSRPLTPLSSDPSDLEPLTPSHFLIGRAMMSVPDSDVTLVPQSRLSRFQRIQELCQHFWKRWSREYVGELQQRTKWRQHHSELNMDSLVLLKDDNLPPVKWRLGRIVELHPGKDGVNRVASVRTANGIFRRSFAKICPLPIDATQSD